MEFSIRRVSALFKKELKDIGKNANALLMCAIPIAFSIIYSKLFRTSSSNSAKIGVLILCLGINLVFVSQFVIAMLIAEEKEKNTLRTLMISGMTPWEFLTGKALITLLMSVIINIVMFLIIGIQMQYLGKYILLTTVVVLSMIEVGAVIGILASDQMATGIVGMPAMMIFFMIPLFANLSKVIKRAAEFLPNYNMNLILIKILKGGTIGHESIYNISVILIWIVIAALFFAAAYNKKGLDR